MSTDKRPVLVMWSEEDACYVAEVLDLPGCMADGATAAEALEAAVEAAREWESAARQLGREIPAVLSTGAMREETRRQESEYHQAFIQAVGVAATRVAEQALRETALRKPRALATA